MSSAEGLQLCHPLVASSRVRYNCGFNQIRSQLVFNYRSMNVSSNVTSRGLVNRLMEILSRFCLKPNLGTYGL
ncbi:hypothetical protein V6N12_001392 [Hibiscus sabdariffa]|uniref:Uncharacterized protein n=1 Tax=Hibiscus sabdariffa TaxID=183260 RepID=A0ABR2AMU3_9ROSI